jgi:hypothetical protein
VGLPVLPISEFLEPSVELFVSSGVVLPISALSAAWFTFL